MIIKYIATIFSLLTLNPLIAQDSYKGNFSSTQKFIDSAKFIPMSKHESYDDDENLTISIKYGKNGIIKKITTERDGVKMLTKLPNRIDKIKWEKIKDGLWINKAEEIPSPKTEFDKDRKIKLHYLGNLEEGAPFDNSFIRNQPLIGKLGYFIKGFSLGVENMKKDELRVIKIAPEMGYGNEQGGNVPPNSTLIYYVYLME